VVHVEQGRAERLVLDPGPILRAVAVSPSGEVWIGGDDGLLAHGNASGFRRVVLGARLWGPVTAMSFMADGDLWAVGPQRVVRMRP